MPILIASEVMDLSAAGLNDADRTTYTYDIQIPYLKMALQELQELFELNSLPVTEQFSSVIALAANETEIQFNVTSAPRLPDNMIEPRMLWLSERNADSFYPLGYSAWTWKDNKITLRVQDRIVDIQIDYIGSLFPKYVSKDTILPVQNGQGFLSYRTAALIKELIERDLQGAGSLNGFASLALDRIQGITIKNKQRIMVRRRPFRSGYKSSSGYN